MKLDLSESVLLENPEFAAKMLRQLRARDIQVCLDDFGTGYSSPSYLHRFPISILKIDCSFVSSIGVKGKNPAIVCRLARLAHELELELIAEGIETSEPIQFLKSLGCHWGQGYWFSPPVDSEAMATSIASQYGDSHLIAAPVLEVSGEKQSSQSYEDQT